MTLQEYNGNLKELVGKTSHAMSEDIIVTNASRMLGSMHVRVFRNGLDSNGQKIGTYSKRPGYFSKKEFIQKGKFKPVGKRGFKGEKVVDTQKLHKYNPILKQFAHSPEKRIVKVEPQSMFLKEGYKELRQIQGRRTDYVNLEYKGDLEGSLKMEAGEDATLIGFDNEHESKKRKGLEEKYRGTINTIFPASDQEKNVYREGVVEDLQEADYEILTGAR